MQMETVQQQASMAVEEAFWAAEQELQVHSSFQIFDLSC